MKIRIKYCNFWNGFNPESHSIFRKLYENYEVAHSNYPDILFFSVFCKTGKLKSENLKYDCTRVFYTHECVKPNYSHCDYSFSFEPTNRKNYQISNIYDYKYFSEFLDQTENSDLKKLQEKKRQAFAIFYISMKGLKTELTFAKDFSSIKEWTALEKF